jgi:phosphopantothenoylcysteine decarboxylase/phosphopantothenate--cysteine ligase
MFNYKILFNITGSIAAYKSAYIISRLVQTGCEVKVVLSDSALKFVGKATFEGLTGNHVYSNSFEENQMMAHINLVKWANVTVLAPATANTINKLANGISDGLITSLFLAHDREKPYIIAPAMNTQMYLHPATQSSLAKLKSWGVKVLPTEKGYLACGDVGEGKLLDPNLIFDEIMHSLSDKNNKKNGKKILITYGGTKEYIDGVRYIGNMSTGKTGAAVSELLVLAGNDITILREAGSVKPGFFIKSEEFVSFSQFREKIESLLSENHFDLIIHLAALSDYSPFMIEDGKAQLALPLNTKMKSESGQIKISLKRNEKMIGKLKSLSKNKNVKVIGFKLTNDASKENTVKDVQKLFTESGADFVVHNDLSNRDKTDKQHSFIIYNSLMNPTECSTVSDLAKKIERITEDE